MTRTIMLSLTLILFFTGCASSSGLAKSADYHTKAGKYYESIGQPRAAKEAYNQARENQDHAKDVFPILVELFNLFNNKDK